MREEGYHCHSHVDEQTCWELVHHQRYFHTSSSVLLLSAERTSRCTIYNSKEVSHSCLEINVALFLCNAVMLSGSWVSTMEQIQNPLETLALSERSWESLAGVSASSNGVYTFTLRSGASTT